jgi:hypothetical protein
LRDYVVKQWKYCEDALKKTCRRYMNRWSFRQLSHSTQNPRLDAAMDKLDDGNVKKLARMKIWKTHEDIIENVDKGIMGK